MQNSIHSSQADTVKPTDPKPELPASAQEAILILAQGIAKYFAGGGNLSLGQEAKEK